MILIRNDNIGIDHGFFTRLRVRVRELPAISSSSRHDSPGTGSASALRWALSRPSVLAR